MRILHLTDIHCASVRRIIENENFDLIAISGDIECLHAINEVKGYNVLAVTGNLDDPHIADVLEEMGFSVENKVVEFGGIRFAGVSGQDPYTSVRKLLGYDFDVLITHYPPYKTVDKAWSGAHIGLKEVRELVLAKKPKLVLCGHVHESPGVTRLGDSLVVNPGPARDGRYAIIEYPDRVTLKRV